MRCICFEQRRWVIFYVLNIYTPHISALQREINCLNRENGNLCSQGNFDFDLQITYQSHYFYENLKWSHGHSGHFALDDFPWNPDRSSVFIKIVESEFFKKSGTHFGVYLRQFDVNPAAISMIVQSGLDQNCPRDSEIHKTHCLHQKSMKSMTYMGSIRFEKRKSVIFYILNT